MARCCRSERQFREGALGLTERELCPRSESASLTETMPAWY
jgi:hypothetical protein